MKRIIYNKKMCLAMAISAGILASCGVIEESPQSFTQTSEYDASLKLASEGLVEFVDLGESFNGMFINPNPDISRFQTSSIVDARVVSLIPKEFLVSVERENYSAYLNEKLGEKGKHVLRIVFKSDSDTKFLYSEIIRALQKDLGFVKGIKKETEPPTLDTKCLTTRVYNGLEISPESLLLTANSDNDFSIKEVTPSGSIIYLSQRTLDKAVGSKFSTINYKLEDASDDVYAKSVLVDVGNADFVYFVAPRPGLEIQDYKLLIEAARNTINRAYSNKVSPFPCGTFRVNISEQLSINNMNCVQPPSRVATICS